MTSAEAVAVLDAIRTALVGEPLTRDELGDAVAELLGSPVLLVDGCIEGVWKHERRAGTLTVAIEPFGDPGAEVVAAAEAEAHRLLAWFGDEELDLSWVV